MSPYEQRRNVMSQRAPEGIAHRLGFSLGVGMRFFLSDPNLGIRWIKRSIFGVVVFGFFAYVGHAVISGLITLFTCVLILSLLAKFAARANSSGSKSDPQFQAPEANSMWDINGTESLWHNDDERRRG